MGGETVFMTFVRAGAKALIMADIPKVPGVMANVVGSGGDHLRDRRSAEASLVPFIAVGVETGDLLIQQLVNNQNQQQNSSPSSFHVTFKYDDNPYHGIYRRFFELPIIFASFLTFALIVYQFINLGLRLNPSTGLPVLSSTKNLVLLMALPTMASIVIMVSHNGVLMLGEGSRPWVVVTAGFMFPCLNLASSCLVARFWMARSDDSVASVDYEDPAETRPVSTAFVVFVGLTADIFHMSASLSTSVDLVKLLPFVFLPLAVGYVFVTAYFFRAGVRILKSLSSDDKPHKTMAFYMIMEGTFSLMIISSFALIGSKAFITSVEAFFLNASTLLLGNYGTTLCHLLIFSGKKKHRTIEEEDVSGGGGGGGGDETFLEANNRELAERNRAQNESIARLEVEKNELEQRAELEQKLLRSFEMQAELNVKLLETEKNAKLGAQREKASFMTALHEVRNPLNGIVLTLEYIFESLAHELSADMKKEIENIETCAGHQQLLLKSIMDLDKVMAGTKDLTLEKFSPVQLCNAAVAMTSHSAAQGVDIIFKNNKTTETLGADAAFMGAPVQLNLVLVNLLSNAAKFTKAGKVEISLDVVDDEIEEEEEEEEEVVEVEEKGNDITDNKGKNSTVNKIIKFAVKDTGPGVPKGMQQKIFGMRGQAGSAQSQAKGFGFGLFVAHELVDRMGGKLKLLSPVTEDGKGSEFSFELRIKECARMETPPPTETQDVERAEGREEEDTATVTETEMEEALTQVRGWRVLLADDGEMNLRLLERKLTRGCFKPLEWQVETATTGEEALAKIDEANASSCEGASGRRMFDLVVFDQNMQPEGILLGTEATKILREKDRKVLIIGCTGNSTDEQRKMSKESGQDLYWSKPAPPNETALKDILGALVKRARMSKRENRIRTKIATEKEKETETEGEKESKRGREKEREKAKEEESIRLPGAVN